MADGLHIDGDWGILKTEVSMAKVSLRAYNREIEGLIEHGQRFDEAVAHCRHILKTFPKHLDTYRLLGKAYLEAKRYDQAVDIFQRILVAAPDDFVSHVGMSIIADDQGKLDESIWHMERAFEVQPANAAIQGELQRLFGRRDGVEPPKIRLTRGALAHMYVQGELYTQAISEIRAVLGQDPKRIDLQVLLAKAYFRSGQNTEAAGVCNDLLSRFPYCLDANRLMVDILPAMQKAESVPPYRQRVIELDPYAAFAGDAVSRTETVPDSAVTLQRLEYSGQPSETGAMLGIGLESAASAGAPPAAEPSWLTGRGGREPRVEREQLPEENLPDFLREAGWSEVGAESAGAPSAAPQLESESAAVPGELPEWVKALAPTEESEASGESGVGLAESVEMAQGVGSGAAPLEESSSVESGEHAVPDWLERLGGRELDEPSPPARPVPTAGEEPQAHGATEVPAQQPAADGRPPWLKDFDKDLEEPIQESATNEIEAAPESSEPRASADLGALGTTAKEQDDALAWLEGLAAKHGAKPEEMVTPAEARTESPPLWVDKAKAIADRGEETWAAFGAPAGGQQPPSGEETTKEPLIGSATGASVGGPAQQASGAEAQSFDWLKDLSDQGTFAGIEAENGSEEAPIIEEQEAPPLPRAAQPPPVGEEPEWLGSEAFKLVEREARAPGEPTGESEAEVSLPDWLADLDQKEATVAGAAPTDSLPAWMKTEAEAVPESTEGTRPSDWQPAETAVASGVAESRVDRSREIPIAPPSVTPPVAAAPSPQVQAETAPTRPRGLEPLPALSKLGGATLGGAQTELARGNIAAALDIYGKLIRKGKSLEDIIRDLRDALYRYPVEVPIWQALGDAYMRANRLQEALDAYTKAEELLR